MGTGMERRWWLALFVGLLFCAGLVSGDSGAPGDDVVGSGDKVAPLIKEIERLKAQVGDLDSSLEKKEAHIGVIEKELTVLKEQQSDGEQKTLAKLEQELDSMAVKVKHLEDQVASTTKDSEQAHKYAEALKSRAEAAEENTRDLTGKLEKSQASFLASKKHAADLEKILKALEVDVSEAEARLKTHGEELSRVHNQWLPPWAAAQVAILRTRAQSKWSSHAKPQVDALYRQASAKAAAAHGYVRPHLDNVANKVGPEVQRHWKTATDAVAPHWELVRTKTANGYDVIRTEYVGKAQEFLQPHYTRVLDTGRPYVTMVQEHTRPYVDQISTASKPYIDNAKNLGNHYLDKASPYYRDAVSAALKHHENLQEAVRSNLSKNEFAASLITKELVWFVASAMLALPVVLAFFIFSSAFGGKKKPAKKHKRASAPGSSASSGVTGHKPKRSKKVDK